MVNFETRKIVFGNLTVETTQNDGNIFDVLKLIYDKLEQLEKQIIYTKEKIN